MASIGRRPSLPPMPDLSHLTAEERKIIESVLLRQREEEEKEQEILRYCDAMSAIFVTHSWRKPATVLLRVLISLFVVSQTEQIVSCCEHRQMLQFCAQCVLLDTLLCGVRGIVTLRIAGPVCFTSCLCADLFKHVTSRKFQNQTHTVTPF